MIRERLRAWHGPLLGCAFLAVALGIFALLIFGG